MNVPVTAPQLDALIRPSECTCVGSTLSLVYHPDGHLDLYCRTCLAHEETDAGFLCQCADDESETHGTYDDDGWRENIGPSWWLLLDLWAYVALLIAVAVILAWLVWRCL